MLMEAKNTSGKRVPGSNLAIWVVLASGVGLLSALIAGLLARWFDYGAGDTIFFGGIMAYFMTLGAIILWRVPGNRIGWVFSVMALCIGFAGVAGGLASQGHLVYEAIGNALWMTWIGSLLVLVFWYPTGTAPTGRWRWAERVLLTAVGATAISALTTERLCLDSNGEGCLRWVDNPIGIDGMPNPEYSVLMGGILLAMVGLALVSLIVRYRRAELRERLQLKWFLLATVTFVLTIGVQDLFEALADDAVPGWVGALNAVAILAIPVASTLAILRYRLYEIDRIISRTVSYALLAGLLGLVFFGSITLFTTFLPSDDPLVVAGATLAVAALFNPLRKRLQELVDRRFNRSGYDAEKVINEFTAALKDRVDPDSLVEDWVGVVAETMQPASVGVWVKQA
jgi:hypothetical protein